MFVLCLLLCLSGSYATESLTGYDPSQLLSQIFNSNDTQLRGGYGLINFDQNFDPDGVNPVVFGDGAGFQGNIKKKRRRKPKKTFQQYAGGYINNGDSFYARPRPSLAAQAVSSVTEALTSIAKYDDYQCVPRLLCEASGGMGQAIPSVPGLESLLTLLSAYTGITTNPLFVFGRAVYLGVSSQGNPASCRYAYPQCPTDAEKLVHYLNNHNGGFFRFFNSPQQQQNLDQFYNHLSNQQYNPDQNPLNPYPQNAGQYGFYKPNLYENQQSYGSAYNHNRYKTNEIQKRIQNRPNSNALEDVIDDAKWTFPEGNREFDNDGFYEEDDNNFKFPESNKNDRKTRGFAFPSNFVVKTTYNEPANNKFVFSNPNNVYDKEKYQEHKYVKQQNYYHKYVQNDNYNYYNREVPVNNHNNYYDNNKYEDNLQTVYVVRGDGDPSRPEIIKLKPGQSIQDV